MMFVQNAPCTQLAQAKQAAAAVLSSRIRSFETRFEQVRTRSDLSNRIGLVFKPRVLMSFYVMRFPAVFIVFFSTVWLGPFGVRPSI